MAGVEPLRRRPGAEGDDGRCLGKAAPGQVDLADRLERRLGGFYFAATESAEAESLRQLRDALSAANGGTYVPTFANWEDAIHHLFAVAADTPRAVVIDDFPYLVAESPALPSIIQRELGLDRRAASRARLVLCGSAVGFMGRLLGAGAPLRGRSRMQMIIRGFDHRLAREFWGIGDPRLALLVHSIVGGTPAYRTALAGADTPTSLAEFDDWVCRTVLNPVSPLFFEATTE